jgi:hypothetical protein
MARARYINVLCGRREHSSGGGLTLKKGIENLSAKSVSRLDDPALLTLRDGKSGINVLCGRREHSSGGGLTPKKGIENREHKERVST